jgi:hypothetical protein
LEYSLEGKWQADIGDGRLYPVTLPGTLDENGIGATDNGGNQWHPDSALGNQQDFMGERVILTRLTRKHTYEGVAELSRKISFEAPRGKRVFLEAERARCLRLRVDGQEVPDFREPSVSTPHVFEVTDFLSPKEGTEHTIVLMSDNSYQGLPHDDILYSSAATDETQTNWNGVLGYLRMRVEEPVFIERVSVYPMGSGLKVIIRISSHRHWKGNITVRSEALTSAAAMEVFGEAGDTEVMLGGQLAADHLKRWDEFEGNLYGLTVSLEGESFSGKNESEPFRSEKSVTFGVRDFGADSQGRLILNGRRIFLRSETNCAVYSETGYCPMAVDEWMEILTTYQSYGVNCVRFHSHCPPEAAFLAADRLGMLMQPELSHWNPRDAFETEESVAYYRAELTGILWMLANHPSFVMLTLGNELHASQKGHDCMKELLETARRMDATRLYADGSNVHYGAAGCDGNSDFYTASNYYEKELRATFANMKGYLNGNYPDAMANYDGVMRSLRESYQGPVFGFEVGQYEVLPDFDELEDFHGVTDPANLRHVQERVEEQGLAPVWKRYVEATGELARLCYREEIEAVLRTEDISGLSLLGLQDFPGQGTALVGMLNSHLKPKPYPFARPERFREFFTDKLPLALLPKYTFENTEILGVEVKVANYGKGSMEGRVSCRLQGPVMSIERTEMQPGEEVLTGIEAGIMSKGEAAEADSRKVTCPCGKLTSVGRFSFSLKKIQSPTQLELVVAMEEAVSRYPVWVYPPVSPVCPESVYETARMDQKAEAVLEAGGAVYLAPPSTKEALPGSIQAQFSTDFWSVGTFQGQEGAMGQLIDEGHPIFREFPTQFHTNWQWWPMASQRAVILPKRYKAIVAELDSYAYLRPMAQLLECRCGKGRLLFSSMGLQDLQMYPEARTLLAAVYRYMESAEFAPEQEISPDMWRELVR